MKQFLFLILAVVPFQLFAQDPDTVLTPQQLECEEVSRKTSMQLIRHMEANNDDSVKRLLNLWEEKCGLTEPLFRAKISYALKRGNFKDSLLRSGTLHQILNYQARQKLIKSSNVEQFEEYKSYYGFIPIGQNFDNYTFALNERLKKQFSPVSVEFLFSELYSSNPDTFFYKIQHPAYNNTTLGRQYRNSVESYLSMAEYHLSVVSGIWIPTGNLSKVGIHPELGFQMGAKKKKMNYDLIMAFKFRESPDFYTARRTKSDNSLEQTKSFFGVMVGADFGYDIYRTKGHEIQIAWGIALDGFDALAADDERSLDPENIWSYNINFGLGYRYYLTNGFYLGLRAKYNMVDYTMNNVIDYKGNPVTLQLTAGTLFNVVRNTNLSALKYRYRK